MKFHHPAFLALVLLTPQVSFAEGKGDQLSTDTGPPVLEDTCGSWTLVENKYKAATDPDFDRCIGVTNPPIGPPIIFTAGQGNSVVTAGGDAVSGASHAWDTATLCDITVVSTAGGQRYEKWEFKPTKKGAKGKASVDYELSVSGSLSLVNADCAASIYAFVHFTSNLGPDKALELNHGKSTGSYSPGSVGVEGPYGGSVTLNIETGTHEGDYPAPDIPDFNGATDPQCVLVYTRQHRTMAYLETWADGGWFHLDLGEATSEFEGRVSSTSTLDMCCD